MHIDEHVADIPRVPPRIDFGNTNFFVIEPMVPGHERIHLKDKM